MTRAYEARITINAPRSTIWALLTDAPRYADWNSTVDKIDGTIAPNEKLKIWAKISPGRAFPAKVSGWDEGSRMEWSFSAPLGVFKGARTFTLVDTPDGVEFHTREEFGGWLAGPITKKMPDLQPTFDAWAADLKRRAETLANSARAAR